MYNDLQVTVAYNKDPSPIKLNLGVGAYRTEVSFFFQFRTFWLHFQPTLLILVSIVQ